MAFAARMIKFLVVGVALPLMADADEVVEVKDVMTLNVANAAAFEKNPNALASVKDALVQYFVTKAEYVTVVLSLPAASTTTTITVCPWALHADKYFGCMRDSCHFEKGYAEGGSFSIDAAMSKCIELGVDVCKAVTCDTISQAAAQMLEIPCCDGTCIRCTVRKSSELTSSLNAETSYVPDPKCYQAISAAGDFFCPSASGRVKVDYTIEVPAAEGEVMKKAVKLKAGLMVKSKTVIQTLLKFKLSNRESGLDAGMTIASISTPAGTNEPTTIAPATTITRAPARMEQPTISGARALSFAMATALALSTLHQANGAA